MQRIQRSTCAFADMDEKTLSAAHLLSQQCPEHISSLLALPRQGQAQMLEWWSPLGGQPIAYAALTYEQQSMLLQRYQQRLHSLQQFAAQSNDADIVAVVKQLPAQPALHDLFSLNQQPVLLNWHNQPQPIVASIVAPPLPTPVPIVRKKSSWSWLLAALLLLLLVAGAWFYFKPQLTEPPAVLPPPLPPVVEPMVEVIVEPDKIEPVAEVAPIVDPVIEPMKEAPKPVVVPPPKPKPRPAPPPPKPKPKPKPKEPKVIGVDPSCGCPIYE